MSIKNIKGNLIQMAQEGKFDVIIHGCNCFNVMGAGFAVQIAYHFPEAVEADARTVKADISKLGTYTKAIISRKKLTVINAYTQYEPGNNFEYAALRQALKLLKKDFTKNARIGINQIGSGIGKGDWSVIETIIHQEMSNHDLTIVEYEQEMAKNSN